MFYATGKSGTIGRFLPDYFLSCNVELTSAKSIKDFQFKKSFTMVHLGGIVGNQSVDRDRAYAFRVNVMGTLNLAERFMESGGERFVFVSSAHVYRSAEGLIDEGYPLEPASEYAEQKLLAEYGLKEMFSHEIERLCVVRIFSILDWCVNPSTLGGTLKRVIEQNQGVFIRNSDDVRDFLTPNNAANILSKIAMHSVSGVVNLCSGVERTVAQAADEMSKKSGYVLPREVFKPGNSQVPRIVGNPGKLLMEVPGTKLDWEPSLLVS